MYKSWTELKKGKSVTLLFERGVDNIAFLNGIAVVMGQEALIPRGETKNAGSNVTKRVLWKAPTVFV
jgi:hypothetical protein